MTSKKVDMCNANFWTWPRTVRHKRQDKIRGRKKKMKKEKEGENSGCTHRLM